jgi:chromosome segregation ATPase
MVTLPPINTDLRSWATQEIARLEAECNELASRNAILEKDLKDCQQDLKKCEKDLEKCLEGSKETES